MRPTALRRLALPAALASIVLFDISCGNDSNAPSPTPTDVIVSPGADTLISLGQTRTFTAQVLDANGHPIDAATVTWSSTAPGILSIDPSSGVATAVANGTAQVKATKGAIEGSANVIVAQIVASVTVTPGNAAFTAVGDTVRFTAVAKDAGNSPVVGVQILWTVSDNTVATIDTLGLAKSKGPGNALVSAQAQTRAGFAAIGVDPSVTQFAILSAPTTAVAGEPGSTALTVELRDAHGNRVMNSSLAVTVAPAGAATGTPLHGATSVLADQGRATFNNLWFEKAGIARFKVSVAALPVDSASLVTVVPDVPARVRLDSVAQFHVAGAPIGLVARVYDRFTNLATNYAGQVHAFLATEFGVGPTSGDSVVSAVAGVATFAALNFHVAATPYFLTADIPGLTVQRDTTIPMIVFPGPAVAIVVIEPAKIRFPFAQVATDSLQLMLSDAFGNLAPSDTTFITFEPIGWPYAAPPGYGFAMSGEIDAITSGGVANIFLSASRPGRGRVVFSAPGLIPDTTDDAPILLPRPLLPSATDVAACITTVYCTGDNAFSQLGVPSAVLNRDSLFLRPDSGFEGDIIQIDGGGNHTCAVEEIVTVGQRYRCWGDNSSGQLGDGTAGGESSFAVVGPMYMTLTSITAGHLHTCAIADGVAKCWGANGAGQLGTGANSAFIATPTTVVGGHTFIQLSAGGQHTCGIDDSAHLWCWGADDLGQLGDSGFSGGSSATPVAVYGGKSWFDVSTGQDFTCAATNDVPAGVYCWGANDKGQLGSLAVDTAEVIPILATSGGLDVDAAGSLALGAKFACASIQSVEVCWGANDHGQLGRGTVSSSEPIPAPVVASGIGGASVGFVRAGAEFACGVTRDFTERYVCWGGNGNGQFGTGHTADSNVPIVVQDQY